jgi:hypothetical protein
MIVFRGRQGGGKTSIIENHLGKVFGDKSTSTTLDKIHDPREFQKWTANVLVNFEELTMKSFSSSARHRTPEVLKQLITAANTQERTFHTQSQQNYNIRATLCATSNKPLAECVSDPTGMRRYWEIICDTSTNQPGFDWDVIESFDWVSLWQGVNENLPAGYVHTEHKLYPTIEAVQDDYCVQPALRTWFEEHYQPFYRPGLIELTAQGMGRDKELLQDGVRALSTLALYGEYVEAMEELGGYALGQSHFTGCLEKLGVRTVPRSPAHAKTKYLVVKKVV